MLDALIGSGDGILEFASAACMSRLAAPAGRPFARHHRHASSAALMRVFRISVLLSVVIGVVLQLPKATG